VVQERLSPTLVALGRRLIGSATAHPAPHFEGDSTDALREMGNIPGKLACKLGDLRNKPCARSWTPEPESLLSRPIGENERPPRLTVGQTRCHEHRRSSDTTAVAGLSRPASKSQVAIGVNEWS